jgi:hypothetical protein
MFRFLLVHLNAPDDVPLVPRQDIAERADCVLAAETV